MDAISEHRAISVLYRVKQVERAVQLHMEQSTANELPLDFEKKKIPGLYPKDRFWLVIESKATMYWHWFDKIVESARSKEVLNNCQNLIRSFIFLGAFTFGTPTTGGEHALMERQIFDPLGTLSDEEKADAIFLYIRGERISRVISPINRCEDWARDTIPEESELFRIILAEFFLSMSGMEMSESAELFQITANRAIVRTLDLLKLASHEEGQSNAENSNLRILKDEARIFLSANPQIAEVIRGYVARLEQHLFFGKRGIQSRSHLFLRLVCQTFALIAGANPFKFAICNM